MINKNFLKNIKSLSLIGNTKNAGKTTVLNNIIYNNTEKILGITSIGLDGESTDKVTNTKKPLIFCKPGTIICTSEKCISESNAYLEILQTIDNYSSYGKLVICRVLSHGYILLSGPSTLTDLIKVKEKLLYYKVDTIITDGAFDKKAFALDEENIILCIGASYSNSMKDTISNAVCLYKKIMINKTNFKHAESIFKNEKFLIGIYDNNFKKVDVSSGYDISSILNEEYKLNCDNKILINCPFTDQIAKFILNNKKQLIKNEFIINSGSSIICDCKLLNLLYDEEILITQVNSKKILTVTINPYSATGNSYDKTIFLNEMKNALPMCEVTNVYEEVQDEIART